MKRTWIAALMIALALPAPALAQGVMPGWCGGAHGPDGTNFGGCLTAERDIQVAGQASGIKRQAVKTPDHPEEIQSPGD
jgi:hypothetical protein